MKSSLFQARLLSARSRCMVSRVNWNQKTDKKPKQPFPIWKRMYIFSIALNIIEKFDTFIVSDEFIYFECILLNLWIYFYAIDFLSFFNNFYGVIHISLLQCAVWMFKSVLNSLHVVFCLDTYSCLLFSTNMELCTYVKFDTFQKIEITCTFIKCESC